MKLSAETKADLRELDYEYGGGITTLGTKTELIDKPILIVGLGGTGVESLIRVKKSINRHFKLKADELSRATGVRRSDKPPQVEYFGIDSDDNLVNIKYMDMSFTDDEFVLLDNANLTSIYKNRDTVFKFSTQDWIADNLRLQQVKHGAGGIRQAGRFLLTINTNRIVNLLTEKINRLTANRNANDLLYVFILVGCAGGTGSGIFIDTPYIIRKIAEQKGFETENIGMIFLPDVTLSDSIIDGSAALNIKANGFAALKELDYLMNIEQNGESFEHNYADLEVRTNRPPYDLCHLISAKDEMGKLLPNAKNYCMNVAAETIINFIASEEAVDGQSYTINSYLSNIENNKAAFLMTHQQKQPVNYIYNTVGAASAQLPIEFLINHLTWKMFSELAPLFDKVPTLESTQQTLEALKIDLQTLERDFNQDKPRLRNFKDYDHAVLAQRPTIIDDAIKQDLVRLKEHYDNKAAQILESFDKLMADKNNILHQRFADLETGPFYLLKELSDLYECSVPGLIDNIRKKDIPHKREHRDTISTLELKRQACIDRFAQKSVLDVFAKKNQALQLGRVSEDYVKAMDKNMAYDTLDSLYETITGKLTRYNDKVIDTFCELLTALKELFDKFQHPQNRTRDITESFTLDLVNALTFCESFEKDNDPSVAIDYKTALKRLLRDMIIKPSWIPGSDNRIVENLNSFVTSQFQNVMHKSLDYYLTLLAKNNNAQADQYIQEKVNTLYEQAKVMFPMNHIPSGLHITFPPYTYLSVPANAPQIRNVARDLAGRLSNIKYSRMVNRLYMLNLKIAVALYCYKELNEYEAVYEASFNKIVGLHLYESSTKNWKNLPSPNYDRLWTAEYENNRERNKNNRIRQIFDQAKEHKLIRLDEVSSRYVCLYGDHIDTDKQFGHIEKAVAARTLSAPQARAAIGQLDNFLNDPAREKHKVFLFDTEFLSGTNKPDDEYAKGVFIYMPALNERMAKEVTLREHIKSLKKELEKIDRNEIKYSHFSQALYMGTIIKRRKIYKYVLDGIEYILYTMENINDQYVDFDVFQEYLSLDEGTATYLQKKAQDAENRYTDEQYAKLLKVIDGYIKSYTEKLELLNQSFYEERDGDLKKLFYREMRDVFIKEKAALS
ncbi:MAG: tubulin-like doman-containing protein [Defluviitaleaceae bacterium]|nr:tubulin-like doman-containing protein [Defluviitaleaceae bacterium]